MAPTIRARPLSGEDHEDQVWKAGSLRRAWGGGEVARKGELLDARSLDGFVALAGDDRVGLLTYAVRDRELEVVTIHVDVEGVGAGRALMDAARNLALELGARRIWLTTTNNNVRALRFYQRWGMDLVGFDRDGVMRSRNVKPSIPAIDADGVPIRHELELELLLPTHG